jgi:hypothetical protein
MLPIPSLTVAVEHDHRMGAAVEDVDVFLAVHAHCCAVDSSDDAILGKNLDGVITSWNSGANEFSAARWKRRSASPSRSSFPKTGKMKKERC